NPGLRRVLAGEEVAHLAAVIVIAQLLALLVHPLRLPAHDEDFLAGFEEVDVDRCFVAGAVGQQVLLPLAALSAGVLVPVARGAGKGDDDDVGITVAVEVAGEAAEGLAVRPGIEGAVRAEDVAGPLAVPVLGRLVPAIADDDVRPAVLV